MVFTQDAVNSDELQRPEYIMSNVCVCVVLVQLYLWGH